MASLLKLNKFFLPLTAAFVVRILSFSSVLVFAREQLWLDSSTGSNTGVFLSTQVIVKPYNGPLSGQTSTSHLFAQLFLF